MSSVALDVGLLYALHEWAGWSLPVATATAYLTAFVANFLLNQRLTFQAGAGHTPIQLVRFVSLALANAALSAIVVTALAGAGMDYRLAKLAMMAAVTLWNFPLLRFWVFREQQPRQPATG